MKKYLFLIVVILIPAVGDTANLCDSQNIDCYEDCTINNISNLISEKRYRTALDILNSYEDWFKAQHISDERGIARISANRAAILYMMGEYESSLSEYRIAQNIYNKLSERVLSTEIQVNISVVLASLNRLDEALREIGFAEKFYKERRMPVDLADVYLTRGIFYFLSNDLQSALMSLLEADKLYLKSGMKIRYLTAQTLIGIIRAKMGEYKEALYLCENNLLSFSLKYYCIALANDGLNRTEEAKKAYKMALSKIDRNVSSTLIESGTQTAQAISDKYAPIFTDYMLFMLKSAIEVK